jgi:hypothetical protein
VALQLGDEPVTAESVLEVILSAPREKRAMRNEEWRKSSLCFRLVNEGLSKRIKIRKCDFNLEVSFWYDFFPYWVGTDADRVAKEIISAIKAGPTPPIQ